jgi:hypothetical protein
MGSDARAGPDTGFSVIARVSAHLKAICRHESIGSPSPSRVAGANRSFATQFSAAESSAFEPDDDLREICDAAPLLGSQK